MFNSTRYLLASIALASIALAAMAGPASADQLRLEVSMAKAKLLAHKKQTTHFKVGLTGFDLKNKRKRTPVNVAIVLDKSGSMTGNEIAKAKEAAIAAIGRLGSRDIVSVIAYDSTVRVIVPATRLTNKKSVCDMIRRVDAAGSTALFSGVSAGADELRKFRDKNRVNRIILLSDGLANVGPKSPSELGNLGASLMKEGISVSTLGLGLDYNEDLMSKLALRSGGNHVFIEKAADLARIFNLEFNDVLSVVAQEVSIEMEVAKGIRPVRVLNMDAEINGQQVIVNLNQLYSKQEKYVLVEVEVPASKAGKPRKVVDVKVSYANMQTNTTDRLTSTLSVNFSKSLAEVEKSINAQVCTACVLQLANKQNILATALRDKGDVEGAKRILLKNTEYLNKNATKYNSGLLRERSRANQSQALQINGAEWIRVRKLMRQQQFGDSVQQAYSGILKEHHKEKK